MLHFRALAGQLCSSLSAAAAAAVLQQLLTCRLAG
jgi:hypothetical protein